MMGKDFNNSSSFVDPNLISHEAERIFGGRIEDSQRQQLLLAVLLKLGETLERQIALISTARGIQGEDDNQYIKYVLIGEGGLGDASQTSGNPQIEEMTRIEEEVQRLEHEKKSINEGIRSTNLEIEDVEVLKVQEEDEGTKERTKEKERLMQQIEVLRKENIELSNLFD